MISFRSRKTVHARLKQGDEFDLDDWVGDYCILTCARCGQVEDCTETLKFFRDSENSGVIQCENCDEIMLEIDTDAAPKRRWMRSLSGVLLKGVWVIVFWSVILFALSRCL